MHSSQAEGYRKSGMELGDQADWLAGATIYQIYVRSFQDTTGDGMGDLPGVTKRLPHIVALGADAIWLSPFFVSPMEDTGYDIADHCNVDPQFGSLMDFDVLVSAAHGTGLKVMIDLVFSHTSDRHPWFQESLQDRVNPRADWYVWADPKPDGTPPNNWLSAFGGSAWTWNRHREQYFLHDFLPSQPSLDFANIEVRQALLEIAEFWVERGVDGFRIDTMNSYFHDRDLRDNPPLPPEEAGERPKANPFAQQLHVYDRAQRGDLEPLEAFVAAIEMLGAATVVGEIGNRLKARAQQGLSRCYTFTLPCPAFTAAEFKSALAEATAQSPDGRICWAFSNHDTTRHVTRFGASGEDIDAVAKLSAVLLAALPGAITLYQGEELGMEQCEIARKDLRDPFGKRFWPELKGRDGCRTPMVWDGAESNGGFSEGKCWLPIHSAHLGRGVAQQSADPGSVLSCYRAAIAFRKRSMALGAGILRFIESDGNVLAFLREGGNETVLAVFNFGRDPARFEYPGEIPTTAPDDAVTGSTMPIGGQLELPAFGYFVGRLAGT